MPSSTFEVTRSASRVARAAAFAVAFPVLLVFKFQLVAYATPLAIGVLLALAAGEASRRQTLGVERDGVRLKPRIGRERFIPFSDVERVTRFVPDPKRGSSGFALYLTGGASIPLETLYSSARRGARDREPIFDAVREAFEEARRVSRTA